MKKIGLIGVGFVLAVALFILAGFAYAQSLPLGSLQAEIHSQSQTTVGPEFPYGRGGWCRGTNGSMIGGMMGFGMDEGQPGLLHDYLWPAVAESFGLTDAQIEAFEIVRGSIREIQINLPQEEIRDTMKQAIAAAIENALADGAITEKQAEYWLEHLEQMEGDIPGMPFGRSGRSVNFRQGFYRGVKFGRQTMVYHEYLDAAIADVLEVSMDDLKEMKIEQGFNLRVYAEEQGLDDDELSTLRMEILTNAANLAVEDGAITQEQADWVLGHLEDFEGRGVWLDQP